MDGESIPDHAKGDLWELPGLQLVGLFGREFLVVTFNEIEFSILQILEDLPHRSRFVDANLRIRRKVAQDRYRISGTSCLHNHNAGPIRGPSFELPDQFLKVVPRETAYGFEPFEDFSLKGLGIDFTRTHPHRH